MEDRDRLNLWLSKSISRVDAEKALAGKSTGTYLVRASVSKPGDYVISLIIDGRMEHHQIKHNHGRMTTLSGKELNNLHELLDHYKKQRDGLSVLLTKGVTAYDPPVHKYVNLGQSPKGYVNMLQHVNLDADSDSDDDDNYTLPPPLKPAKISEKEINPARINTICEVGHGQFGQVFEAWLTPVAGQGEGKLVAVKTCKETNSSTAANNFLAEAETLLQFKHPNVLALLGVVIKQQPLLIVVEYMQYGDVRAALKGCRSKNVGVFINEQIHMARQVAAGMQHLVDKNFVHRDLAARNVLLGKFCEVKIADFGLSRALDEQSDYYTMINKSMLPMKWMAPEALNRRTFSFASDTWSFGVVMWEIFSLGKTPWKKLKSKEVIKLVGAGERLDAPRGCPDNIYKIMRRCWDDNPKKRPKFQELYVLLSEIYDFWLSKNGQEPRDLGAILQRLDESTKAPESLASRLELPGKGVEFPREQLRFVGNLGEGEFGQVVQMEFTSGIAGSKSMVAAKMLKEDADSESRVAFKGEMDLLVEKKFQHKNVVSVLGICTTDEPLMIIMEYVNLGDLHSYLIDLVSQPLHRAPPLKHLADLGAQVAEGMAYLSSRGCVHRDLAARNCLVGSGPVVKISDFGLGRVLAESLYYKTAGGILPIRWMAPESINYGKFTTATDVYSYGVTLYELYTFGAKPFANMTNLEIANTMSEGGLLALQMPEVTPTEIVKLQKKCCSGSPDFRPSFSDIAKKMQQVCATTPDAPAAKAPAKREAQLLHCGWMTKQGGGTSIFGSARWRRRWFVLRADGQLSYHKSEKDKPLNSINCKSITKVQPESALDPSFEDVQCFSISVPSRVYNLVCADAKDRQQWFDVLARYAKV